MPNQNYHFMHQFPNQTQLYLGNLNQYSSSSILTPESSIHSSNSLSPNTNSISSASTSSSIVDSPSNVSNSSLINNQNTNNYLFNQSALATGNSKSNGISHQSYLVTDTNNHNTEGNFLSTYLSLACTCHLDANFLKIFFPDPTIFKTFPIPWFW